MKKTYLFLFLLPLIALGLLWLRNANPPAENRQESNNLNFANAMNDKQIVKKTKKSTIYQDTTAPGRYKGVFTIDDQYYEDEKGNLQPIIEDLEDDGNEGFDKKSDKTQHILRISQDGKRRWYPRRNVKDEYVSITGIEHYENGWKNLKLPVPTWKEQKAEWNMPNLSIITTNSWNQVKTDYVLKDKTAPTRLRFALELTKLTIRDWELYSGETVVGTIDSPFAYDANKAEVPVTAGYQNGYIEWNVDTIDAVYPIYVDPTFTDGYGGDVTTSEDTMLYENTPTEALGSAELLILRGNDPYKTPSLLRFTLTALEGKTITGATLSLYQRLTDFGGDTSDINVYRILPANANWTEAGATWNTKDGTNPWTGSAGCWTADTDYDSTSMATITYDRDAPVHTEYPISLNTTEFTSMVTSNAGLIIISTYNADTAQFESSDYFDTDYRPKLVVEYQDPPGMRIEGLKIQGLCAGSTACGCALGAYHPSPNWTKIADTSVRDISSLESFWVEVAKDIYCDDNNCILWTDGAPAPTIVCIATDSNVYGNILWSKTDSGTQYWAEDPASAISGGDIGGTHPSGLKVGNVSTEVGNKNWLARDYTSAEGTYLAMDVCKAKGAGWRLPTALELDSIRDQGKGSSPYTRLPNITGVTYISSSEHDSDEIYEIFFGNGDGGTVSKYGEQPIRCVRPF